MQQVVAIQRAVVVGVRIVGFAATACTRRIGLRSRIVGTTVNAQSAVPSPSVSMSRPRHNRTVPGSVLSRIVRCSRRCSPPCRHCRCRSSGHPATTRSPGAVFVRDRPDSRSSQSGLAVAVRCHRLAPRNRICSGLRLRRVVAGHIVVAVQGSVAVRCQRPVNAATAGARDRSCSDRRGSCRCSPRCRHHPCRCPTLRTRHRCPGPILLTGRPGQPSLQSAVPSASESVSRVRFAAAADAGGRSCPRRR